ncbi:hypothetical protein GDO81_020482 [Engystomops pustulosus]|uniref:Secreted protein n=1 Tax=Engystomops pustulosus TaxID=76066 RepID=A0AAV6Z163_ENGPU|nr:hypothetical protein GDO81_020482 [Engystomops pustulosus]
MDFILRCMDTCRFVIDTFLLLVQISGRCIKKTEKSTRHIREQHGAKLHTNLSLTLMYSLTVVQKKMLVDAFYFSIIHTRNI